MTPPATVQSPFNHGDAQFAFTAHDNRGKLGNFDFYRDRNGLLFLANPPADMRAYYEGGFQPIPDDVADLERVAGAEAFKIDQIGRFRPTNGDYLEIGPWIGMAAYNALKAGFSVRTMEMNSQCVELMRKAGIDAVETESPLRTLESTRDTFDVIAMWHSIEHVPEPWKLIELCAERVRPGGLLVVAAPNPESAQARYFGKDWFHLDAPRHINLLPMELVRELATKSGLSEVFRTTDDELGLHLDRQGWEWPIIKHIGSVPLGKGMYAKFAALYGAALARKYRKGGDDGGAYTLIYQRPV